MNNFFKILAVAFTLLIVGGAWWATQNGWSLPRLQFTGRQTAQDCPQWQRDQYGNCPPKTHRLRLGFREFEDNNGK